MKLHPARAVRTLDTLERRLTTCRICPRLVEHREAVARTKRAAFRDETYWARPVPGFGDPKARLVVVGLAPGAHGANRTGRMFTGDASGDFLYPALYRAGLSSKPTSVSKDDGLELFGTWITNAARCAPPDNMPTRDELDACRPWLARELELLSEARAYLALGKIAYDTLVALARDRLEAPPPPFAHDLVTELPDPRGGSRTAVVIASYHVSRQNTQTGRLTQAMFDRVLAGAKEAAGLPVK